MTKTKDSKTFESNYKKLQEIAATLRSNQFIDIDQLLPMVKEATSAYEKCKLRLKSVSLALDKHFKDQE